MSPLPTRWQLLDVLEQYSLRALKPHVDELFRSSVGIYSKSAVSDDELPVGASKFGGSPDLPFDEPWPESRFGPVPFMAQIRCQDVAMHDAPGLLPQTGILYFFLDFDAFMNYRNEDLPPDARQQLARVLFVNDERASISRRPPPTDAPKHKPLRTTPLRFSSLMTIAPIDAPEFENLNLTLSEREEQKLFDFIDDLGQPPDLQMLGYTHSCQGDVRKQVVDQLYCYGENWEITTHAPSNAEVRSLATDWQPLLLKDWGGDNFFYEESQNCFLIRADDLKNHRFDRAGFVNQAT